MELIWLLGAGLALYSLRARGSLYHLFLTLGLLVIAGSAFFSLTCGVVLAGNVDSVMEVRIVGLAFLFGLFGGGWLFLALANSWALPAWLTWLLPVRGIHARRLLAACALLGIAGPGVSAFSLFVGMATTRGSPPVGVALMAVGFIPYLAPFWDHLVGD